MSGHKVSRDVGEISRSLALLAVDKEAFFAQDRHKKESHVLQLIWKKNRILQSGKTLKINFAYISE